MRRIFAFLVVILLAGALWWYVSPIFTLHAMRDAAKDRDAARLSAYVDYPALRDNLKDDLRRQVLSDGSKGGRVGALGAGIAMAFLGPVVDTLVSPEGVEAMFAEQNATKGRGAARAPVTAGDHPVIERDGLDSFRVRGQDPSKGALVFHREGLGWKLVGVDLPVMDH